MSAMVWISILFSVLPVSWATAQQRLTLDSVHSYFEFRVRTRLGQSIDGVFPRLEGEVVILPEGARKYGCTCMQAMRSFLVEPITLIGSVESIFSMFSIIRQSSLNPSPIPLG